MSRLVNVDDLDELAVDELRSMLDDLKSESVFLNKDMLDIQEKANIINKQIQKLSRN